MAGVNMGDYVDVAERLRDLAAKYPDASLQPTNLERPYWFETQDGQTFLVYSAACYRYPDDPRPGIGDAWEQFPGKTNFTRGSELMNAQTSAWGRAIVAALASSAKRGVASREEVESARASQPAKSGGRPVTGLAEAKQDGPPPDPRIAQIVAAVKQLDDDSRNLFKVEFGSKPSEIHDFDLALKWLNSQTEPF